MGLYTNGGYIWLSITPPIIPKEKFVSGKGLGRSEESAVKVRGGAGL